MSERFEQVVRIFNSVASAPADQRAALLDAACGNDTTLRAEVESLLRQDFDETTCHMLGGMRERVDVPLLASTAEPVAAMPERIGEFMLVALLGAGGMGVVYLARQAHPDRDVALKVIRPGYLTRAYLRRFQYEADLLARVNHPGIAQVFEAGVDATASQPVPYIAMEYIPGARSLTTHVRQTELAPRAMIELFTQVCDAVEHGHRRGIIHRDLKPSNILVGSDGTPKIIDFGVARAMDADHSASMRTMAGQLVGTLGYMSPEAVRANPDEIDTRTDVYALGAVLYELVTGSLPHPVNDLPLPEAARRIAEDAVPRPSIRSVLDIGVSLRSDLDTIVLKALEKDRERRYASVGELTEELRRSLRGEAILARRGSKRYVIGRFVSRHRVALSFGAVGLVAITALGGNAAWQFHQRGVLKARAFEMLAYSQRELDDPFDPVQVTPAEVNEARAFADEMLAGHEDLEAMMRVRTGLGYFSLESWANAEAEFRRALALAIKRATDGPEESVASIRWHLGNALYWRGEIDAARSEYEACLRTRVAMYGERHVLVADALTGLGACDRRQGDFERAHERNLRVVALEKELRGPDDPWIAASINNLAVLQRDRGDFEQARLNFTEALDRIERLDVRPEFRARTLRNIATCWLGLGDPAAAEAATQDAEAIVRESVGTHSSERPPCLTLRAWCALAKGDAAGAERLAREALAVQERSRLASGADSDPPSRAMRDAQVVLARALLERIPAIGSVPLEAITLAEGIYAARADGPDVLAAAEAAVLLAEVRLAQGDADAARDLCRSALAAQQTRLLPSHPDLNRSQRMLSLATS